MEATRQFQPPAQPGLATRLSGERLEGRVVFVVGLHLQDGSAYGVRGFGPLFHRGQVIAIVLAVLPGNAGDGERAGEIGVPGGLRQRASSK